MGITLSSTVNCTHVLKHYHHNNTTFANCDLNYHEKIFLGFASVVGVFFAGPCLAFAAFYLKKCYMYAPYSMLYNIMIFLCGIVGTFLSMVCYNWGETLITLLAYVPLPTCFACLMVHVGNILLTKRYDCRLRDGVLVAAAILIIIIQLSVLLSAPVYVKFEDGAVMFWKWKLSQSFCHSGLAIITVFGMSLCCCRDYPHGASVFGVSMSSLILWVFYMCIGEYQLGVIAPVFMGATGFIFLLMYGIPELAFLYYNYKFIFSSSGSESTVRLFSDV
ncbi:G protein coupled receptor 3 [Elephant endotheliotropic herpesvirus 5B]|nr:G protein coupled receptor 3 [Elephant endotheliotropic herpesvirus 5B]